jgi:hypothetical protein
MFFESVMQPLFGQVVHNVPLHFEAKSMFEGIIYFTISMMISIVSLVTTSFK